MHCTEANVLRREKKTIFKYFFLNAIIYNCIFCACKKNLRILDDNLPKKNDAKCNMQKKHTGDVFFYFFSFNQL